jgi:hypothetical protein
MLHGLIFKVCEKEHHISGILATLPKGLEYFNVTHEDEDISN